MVSCPIESSERQPHDRIRPQWPQTNGLVERFNRRIAEAIGREPKRGSARRTFLCHADRDAFLARFVADYNRTRLKCLGHLAPAEALANLPGPNTYAGTTKLLSRIYRHGSTMILVCASGLARSAKALATPSMPTLAVTMEAASTLPSAIRRSESANSSGV
jgi:hypothetical protein